MRAFVINLDRDTARLDHVRAQFEALDLPFERLAAVDGTALEGNPTSITRGEMACYLSHADAWKRIAQSGQRFGAVFEDDVHVAPSIARLLSDDRWIPDDADIVKLETRRNPVYADRSGVELDAGGRLVRLRSAHYGAAGYVVSSPVVKELLKTKLEPSLPVDDLLFENQIDASRPLVIYQVEPAVCIQDDRLKSRLPDRAFTSNLATERDDRIRQNRTLAGRAARLARSASRRLVRYVDGRRRGYNLRKIAFAGTE